LLWIQQVWADFREIVEPLEEQGLMPKSPDSDGKFVGYGEAKPIENHLPADEELARRLSI